MISSTGMISGLTKVPANVDERDSIYDYTYSIHGFLIADKGYIRPLLKTELFEPNIDLQTILRRNMKETRPKQLVKHLSKTRRLIETVIGQLTERFQIETVRARDILHLTNRFVRKILSHTIAIFLNRLLGRKDIQFDGLIS